MKLEGIYFIGGASGAGKTRGAQQLAQISSLPAIEIDALQRLLIPAIPDTDLRSPVVRALTRVLLEQLIQVRATCIVDGAWLEPEMADRLKQDSNDYFHPVFCGYSSENLEARYQSVRHANEHWLAYMPDDWARAFVQKQVSDSSVVAQKCRELNIDYVDFTDFASGSSQLLENFAAWKSRLE